jgi:transcriptional antiterminator NusG
MPVADIFSPDSQKPRWYIVQTYVGFEDAVKRTLEQKVQNLSLQNKILEIFVPTKKVVKLTSKNERREKEEKVYPGYIYLHMILDRETGYIIQNTQYVSKIAGTGEHIVALEEGYVENLKKQLINQGQTIESMGKVKYKIGDLVKVVEGPFKDMQGKVSGLDPEQSRVNVLLTMFDRETDVELDVLQVKKVV